VLFGAIVSLGDGGNESLSVSTGCPSAWERSFPAPSVTLPSLTPCVMEGGESAARPKSVCDPPRSVLPPAHVDAGFVAKHDFSCHLVTREHLPQRRRETLHGHRFARRVGSGKRPPQQPFLVQRLLVAKDHARGIDKQRVLQEGFPRAAALPLQRRGVRPPAHHLPA